MRTQHNCDTIVGKAVLTCAVLCIILLVRRLCSHHSRCFPLFVSELTQLSSGDTGLLAERVWIHSCRSRGLQTNIWADKILGGGYSYNEAVGRKRGHELSCTTEEHQNFKETVFML